MEVQIRRLLVEDLDQIMEIEPVAFGSHHWSKQSFINELNNAGGTYFSVIEPKTGTVCGYSGYWLIGDEAHITTLATHPDFRRQGIGELLLINDILSAIKVGAKCMTLEVRVSNDPAQQLYYKYGFKSMGLRRKYYQDNSEDALVLWMENIRSHEFSELLIKGIADFEAEANHVKTESLNQALVPKNVGPQN
ncbi:MAG: ribosomal protein S18-alanine N-acetyltransferase [Candidatus Obscuribacterales bacterium]|nr:ribosomal protein S18-alanine N-acetyltransferase [Candidatus Obscuribacterales bacterium]